jgi:hypothetical protein
MHKNGNEIKKETTLKGTRSMGSLSEIKAVHDHKNVDAKMTYKQIKQLFPRNRSKSVHHAIGTSHYSLSTIRLPTS